MENELNKLADMLILNEIKLPITLEATQNPILFDLLNQSLSKRKNLLFPNFNNSKTVCIFSDYGGESPNSKYYTYSFLFVDYDFLGVHFAKEINRIRAKYILNEPYKEIAFKDLKYGPICRALDEYLNIVNNSVNGLVFTLIVEKSITSILGLNEKNTYKLLIEELKKAGLGEWHGETAEKMQRIIGTISYFVNLLVPSGKQIFWMTDNDNIVANSKLLKSIGDIFNNAVHQFKDVNYPLVGYATPFEKGTDPLFIDLLSISDLVAGAVEHYFTRKTILDDLTISEGANKILKWLSLQGLGLKKLSLIVRSENEAFTGSLVDFHLTEPIENGVELLINKHTSIL